MDEFSERLARQARWQKNRMALSWPEKVRQAEALRDSIMVLRSGKSDRLLSRQDPGLSTKLSSTDE